MILSLDETGEQNLSTITTCSGETLKKISFCSFMFDFRELKLFKPV